MSKQDYYVVTHQDGWAVKKAGSQKASLVTHTQKEAIEKARELAKKNNSELTIQGRNGKFREKNSYGNDPENIKG